MPGRAAQEGAAAEEEQERRRWGGGGGAGAAEEKRRRTGVRRRRRMRCDGEGRNEDEMRERGCMRACEGELCACVAGLRVAALGRKRSAARGWLWFLLCITR